MQQIADETALYCEKLNRTPGTQAYSDCLLVLGDFRLRVEQRVYSERDFSRATAAEYQVRSF